MSITLVGCGAKGTNADFADTVEKMVIAEADLTQVGEDNSQEDKLQDDILQDAKSQEVKAQDTNSQIESDTPVEDEEPLNSEELNGSEEVKEKKDDAKQETIGKAKLTDNEEPQAEYQLSIEADTKNVQSTSQKTDTHTPEELAAMARSVFKLCNDRRSSAGLGAYTWNDELAAAAQIRAKELETSFSSTRPNGSEYWSIDENLIFGENHARGQRDENSAVESWMNSTIHKENILSTTFHSCGIAVYEASDGQMYWVEEFGY